MHPSQLPAQSKDVIGSHVMIQPNQAIEVSKRFMELADSLGSSSARLGIYWSGVQPTESQWDFQWVDSCVSYYNAANINVLAFLGFPPQWASSNPHPQDGRFPRYAPRPDQMVQWKNYIQTVVKRYYGKVRLWEIWNEPNPAHDFFRGTSSQYAELLSTAHDVIKDVDPDAIVLIGGVTVEAFDAWMNSVLDDPGFPCRKKFDVMNIHVRGSFAAVRKQVTKTRSYLEEGGMKVPLWITEFGYPAEPGFQSDGRFRGKDKVSGEEAQCDYYRLVVPWLLSEGGVERIFVTLEDYSEQGKQNRAWHTEGVVDLSFRPKRSFRCLKELARVFNSGLR
jgi:hypothetical protein